MSDTGSPRAKREKKAAPASAGGNAGGAVAYKDAIARALREEAEVIRDLVIGGKLEELGCGHNPKAPRFDIYPAGPNSPGGLHFGINGANPSNYLRRMMPNWEEPHVHMDLVTFDSTVTAGNQILIDQGYLMSLKDPKVIETAERYGDPVDLLEAFPV